MTICRAMISVRSVCSVYTPVCKYFIRTVCEEAGVRVRFAPSPTGLIHLGGLRTALYNYIFAKSKNGSFILRIEDTDQTRLVKGAVEKLEDDLMWAGLYPDEGPSAGGSFGPYFQSKRLDLYKQEVSKLLANGMAYPCFCSDRRLDILRKDSLRRREIPKYDNHCRLLNAAEVQENIEKGWSHCIRFKLTPFSEPYKDLVFGEITHDVAQYEGDFVILKSDGFPTYHLANVVDDHYMKISHVLRGVEWQPSTSKHLLLYRAFQWNPPKYAHLPVLLNEDGSKLSKRNNDLTVDALRKKIIYPTALMNFLTLCGGGFLKTSNSEKITRLQSLDELIEKFSIDFLNVNNCKVPLERLKEFNRIELKLFLENEKSLNELVKVTRKLVLDELSQRGLTASSVSDERLKQILKWSSTRVTSIADLVSPGFLFLWTDPSEDSVLKCSRKFIDTLSEIISEVEKLQSFDESQFFKKFNDIALKNDQKYSELMKSLRICLMGSKQGPSISELFNQLGREVTINRLKRAQSLYEQISKNEKVSAQGNEK